MPKISALSPVAFVEHLSERAGLISGLFGDGVKAAVEKIGEEAAQFAKHTGGQGLPMQGFLCKPGFGASYVIDATPGRHTQWSSWNVEDGFAPAGLNPPPIADKYHCEGKGDTHFIMSNCGHCVNMAGTCWCGTSIGPANALPEGLTLATGMKFT